MLSIEAYIATRFLQLRHEGDPLCDAVVRFFKLKTGQDALKALESYVTTTPREQWDEDVAKFWDSTACDPPGDVSALSHPARSYNLDGSIDRKGKRKMVEDDIEEILKSDFTPDEAMHKRNRQPQAVLSEGQAVFWRYSSGMLTTLLHFSLAGGKLFCRAALLIYLPVLRYRLIYMIALLSRLCFSSHHGSPTRNWIPDFPF